MDEILFADDRMGIETIVEGSMRVQG
jgi:hypothetical protein